MDSTAPLFSIVIPTRNRAHLLGYALRSALTQTFNDYEIIVMANDCKDDTRQVVTDIKSNKIKYFETDRMLTMPENWEYAWTKATGDYVIYLPDDDALIPTALQLLSDQALKDDPPVISWEDAVYYYPTWHDKKAQNILLMFFYGEQLIEDVPGDLFLRQCRRFEFAWSSPLPKLLNCAAKRTYFEGWRQKLGQLFYPVAPDYSFAWISSHVCSQIRIVHYPLSIRGISDYSIGSNVLLGESSKEFFREFGNFDFFSNSLLKIPSTYNHLATTFLRINVAFKKRGMATTDSIDWEQLMIATAKELKNVEADLPNWSDNVEKLLSASKKLSETNYKEVDKIIHASAPPVSQEGLYDLRVRTGKMAMEYPLNLSNLTQDYSGDEQCARCVLGLEEAILAEGQWKYLYLFGDDLNVKNIYDMSLLAEKYYTILLNCRAKQKKE